MKKANEAKYLAELYRDVPGDGTSDFLRLAEYGTVGGTTAKILFDAQGRISEILDRNDRSVLSYIYNTDGLIGEIQDGSGRSVRYAYSGGLLTDVTDADGKTTHYDHVENGLDGLGSDHTN